MQSVMSNHDLHACIKKDVKGEKTASGEEIVLCTMYDTTI